MSQFQVTFDSPGFLALFLLTPWLWWMRRGSLSQFGAIRQWLAFGLRLAVAAALVLALAEMRIRLTSDRLTVLYLLDQSSSIPSDQRQAMLDYVSRETASHRDAGRRDRAGVIVFGRDAAIETPPLEEAPVWLGADSRFSSVNAEATNLAGALKLAQATFPPDAAKRIVLVTDGNETLGGARDLAPLLAAQGIGIDVVPIALPARTEISLEKLVLPSAARRGQPLAMRVVVSREEDGDAQSTPGNVSARLKVVRKVGKSESLLVAETVELQPGKNVLSFEHTIDESGFFTFEARIDPADPARDRIAENNAATAFTHVQGEGRVLLIEDAERPGRFAFLIERLRANRVEVVVQGTDDLYSSFGELQAYDTVILADVPRASAESGAGLSFSDEQVDLLVRNAEMGCGLVMLGGPSSFGAGGWTNTRLEEAMPVDFQIKNTKIVPVGALMLVIDKSGSMQGDKIAMSRRAAVEAVKALGSKDYVGVVAFDSAAHVIVPMGRMRDPGRAVTYIGRLGADGGTDMYPGMQEGFRALRKVNASLKHMIVLTDGQTQGTGYESLVRQMREANITVSAVAVGADAVTPLLMRVATEGGGKFYDVRNPRAIPRIFMKEAMRIARPLVYEREQGFSPFVTFPHEMLGGIDGALPEMRGFVLTSVKDNPLVEVSIASPVPGEQKNSTILASWTYGLGRTVAFTSDAGGKWTSAWTGWNDYDKLFSQIVRWSMRPLDDDRNFALSLDLQDGRGKLVVTALDKDDAFLNFLTMQAVVVAPDSNSVGVEITQTAPGRYEGEFPALEAGSYFLSVAPQAGKAPLRAGLVVPYSAEYRRRETNWPLLESLSRAHPRGGEKGELIANAFSKSPPAASRVNTFRHNLLRAESSREIWPLLVLAGACVFFFDVLCRRVVLGWEWLRRLRIAAAGLFGEKPAAAERIPRLDRLRRQKESLATQIDSQRKASRFEPPLADAEPPSLSLEDAASKLFEASVVRPTTAPDSESESISYTDRLLRAKRRARGEN